MPMDITFSLSLLSKKLIHNSNVDVYITNCMVTIASQLTQRITFLKEIRIALEVKARVFDCTGWHKIAKQ